MTEAKNLLRPLSENYERTFLKNVEAFLKNIRAHAANKPKKKYCLFYPSFGSKNDFEFLVYGQAVNGWGVHINIDDSSHTLQSAVRKSIDFSNEYYKWNDEKPCPLDWVNIHWSKKSYQEKIKSLKEKTFYTPMEYSTARSFFWNVANRVISEYFDPGSDGWYKDWATKLVWSNLYKISPEKRNPSPEERLLQQPLSARLVKMELDEIQPTYCLVLTNDSWWEPFREELKTERVLNHKLGPEIESVEIYKETTKIIVTKRPFSGNAKPYQQKILKLLKSEK